MTFPKEMGSRVFSFHRALDDTGDVPDEVAEFSRQLADWLKSTHELAAQPTPRTIENRIRTLWHDYHAQAHKIIILCVFFVRPNRRTYAS